MTAKKRTPKVTIKKVTDADLLASLGLEEGYQAHAGDWTGDVRTTEARAQREADAYIKANFADDAPADDEDEPVDETNAE